MLEAAIEAFAANGFEGAGTRDIAAAAGVTQGLVTYYFETKEDLWRAAADHLFGDLVASLPDDFGELIDGDETTREAVRAGVRLAARRPELFRFMFDVGRQDNERLRWLVDTHLREFFARFEQLTESRETAAHLFYALNGASSLMFAAGAECMLLTGVDVTAPDTIERHADLLARLFAP